MYILVHLSAMKLSIIGIRSHVTSDVVHICIGTYIASIIMYILQIYTHIHMCVYIVHTQYILSIYIVHTQYIHCTYSVYTLYIYIQYIHCTYSVYRQKVSIVYDTHTHEHVCA